MRSVRSVLNADGDDLLQQPRRVHHIGDGDVLVGRVHVGHAGAEDRTVDAVLGVDVGVGAAADALIERRPAQLLDRRDRGLTTGWSSGSL